MEQSQKNKKLALYTFLEVVCTLLLTIVGSMWDWVNMSFTLSRIATGKYWGDVFVQTVMYSCALLIATFSILEKKELNDVEYHDLLGIYRERRQCKDKAFIPYIDNVLNPSIKKKYIKKKYENKLYKLDRFSRDVWQLEYNKKKKIEANIALINRNIETNKDIKAGIALKERKHDLEEFKFSSEASRKYHDKKKVLEEMASDEYIEENWENINIKYPKVNPYAFTYYLDIKITDESMYKVENETAKELPHKILRKFMYSFGGALIVGLLLINPQANELLEQANGWIALMIQYIFRVGMIFGNFMLGVYTGKKLFRDNFILPIVNRTRILEEYQLYKDNHPEHTRVEEIKEQLSKEYNEKFKSRVEEIKEEFVKAYSDGVQ